MNHCKDSPLLQGNQEQLALRLQKHLLPVPSSCKNNFIPGPTVSHRTAIGHWMVPLWFMLPTPPAFSISLVIYYFPFTFLGYVVVSSVRAYTDTQSLCLHGHSPNSQTKLIRCNRGYLSFVNSQISNKTTLGSLKKLLLMRAVHYQHNSICSL